MGRLILWIGLASRGVGDGDDERVMPMQTRRTRILIVKLLEVCEDDLSGRYGKLMWACDGSDDDRGLRELTRAEAEMRHLGLVVTLDNVLKYDGGRRRRPISGILSVREMIPLC